MNQTNQSPGGYTKPKSNWLQRIDRYGAKPRLLYNGEESYKTRLGGLITILEITSKIVCVGFLILQFTTRQSSETNINTLFKKNPSGFNLTKETLPFAFGLQFRNTTHFIDESVYTAHVNYVTMRKVMQNGELIAEKSMAPLELITCDQAGLDLQFFQNLDTSKMFCLKDLISESRSIQITGVFESDFYGFLDIQINRCTGNACKAEAELEEILGSSYFAINYVNFAIKSSNFSSPIEKYPTSYYTSTSTQYTKYIQMRMTDQEVRTDSSILGLGFFKTERFTSTDQFYNDLAKINSGDGSSNSRMLSVLIRMNQMLILTSRSYKSLFQFVAELGGIFQVVSLVAFFIAYRYAASNMMLDVYHYFSKWDVFSLVKQTDKNPNLKNHRSATVNPFFHPPLRSKKPKRLVSKSKSKLLKKSGEDATQGQQKYVAEVKEEPELPRDPVGLFGSLLFSKKAENNGAAVLSEENEANMDRPSMNGGPSKPARLQTVLPKAISKMHTAKARSHLQSNAGQAEGPLGLSAAGNFIKEDKYFEKKATVSTRVQELNRLGSIDMIDTVTLIGQESLKIKEKFIHLVGNTEYSKNRKRFYFFDGKPSRRNFSTSSLLAQSYTPFLLPKKSHLKRVMESSQREVLIDLDYLNILKMYRDVQKLKCLLLSPEQRLLFDYYHVSADRFDSQQTTDAQQESGRPQQQSQEQKRTEILDALRTIKASKVVDCADRELLLCLGFLLNEVN